MTALINDTAFITPRSTIWQTLSIAVSLGGCALSPAADEGTAASDSEAEASALQAGGVCREDSECFAPAGPCRECPDGSTFSCPTAVCDSGQCKVEQEPCPPVACGGIAGLPCPPDMSCVDDPADDCDPKRGGADCIGICTEASCDASLQCLQVITCVDGQLYPTSCGPKNCDEPVGGCDGDKTQAEEASLESDDDAQANTAAAELGAKASCYVDPRLPPPLPGKPSRVHGEFLGCGPSRAPLFDVRWQEPTCDASYYEVDVQRGGRGSWYRVYSGSVASTLVLTESGRRDNVRVRSCESWGCSSYATTSVLASCNQVPF